MRMLPYFLKTHKSVRFAFVGGIGFIIDLTTLLALTDIFNMELLQARFLSFVAAATCNWFLNRSITFPVAKLNINKSAEWLRFLTSSAISAIPNIGIFYLLILILPATFIYIIIAMCSGILIGYYSNYKLSVNWVFKTQIAR